MACKHMLQGGEGMCPECTEAATTIGAPTFIFKPDYTITFSSYQGLVGTLDFNGPEMVFTGNAEESAKVFMDFVATSFTGRLKEEREACAKMVDHILKEGGGTWGDALREL